MKEFQTLWSIATFTLGLLPIMSRVARKRCNLKVLILMTLFLEGSTGLGIERLKSLLWSNLISFSLEPKLYRNIIVFENTDKNEEMMVD